MPAIGHHPGCGGRQSRTRIRFAGRTIDRCSGSEWRAGHCRLYPWHQCGCRRRVRGGTAHTESDQPLRGVGVAPGGLPDSPANARLSPALPHLSGVKIAGYFSMKRFGVRLSLAPAIEFLPLCGPGQRPNRRNLPGQVLSGVDGSSLALLSRRLAWGSGQLSRSASSSGEASLPVSRSTCRDTRTRPLIDASPTGANGFCHIPRVYPEPLPYLRDPCSAKGLPTCRREDCRSRPIERTFPAWVKSGRA